MRATTSLAAAVTRGRGIAHIREACRIAEILAAAAPASREARLRHAAATVSADRLAHAERTIAALEHARTGREAERG